MSFTSWRNIWALTLWWPDLYLGPDLHLCSLLHQPWAPTRSLTQYFFVWDSKAITKKIKLGNKRNTWGQKAQRLARQSFFCPEPPLALCCPACQEQAQTRSTFLHHSVAAVYRKDTRQQFPSVYCQTHQIHTLLHFRGHHTADCWVPFVEYETKWRVKHLRTWSVLCEFVRSSNKVKSYQTLRAIQLWIFQDRSGAQDQKSGTLTE